MRPPVAAREVGAAVLSANELTIVEHPSAHGLTRAVAAARRMPSKLVSSGVSVFDGGEHEAKQQNEQQHQDAAEQVAARW